MMTISPDPIETPAPVVPPMPRPAAPQRTTSKWRGLIAGIGAALLVICCLGLLAIWVGSESGGSAFLVGLALAIVPVPLYTLLAVWMDRFEPEPAWMLIGAFIWGGVVATAVSAILNTAGGLAVALMLGDVAGEMFSAVMSAPFVEETTKGLALLILFLWKKDEFDNIVDGVLYAAMLGLGFAMIENVIYYGRAYYEEGFSGSMTLFVLRGLITSFLHPLCTSMTGVGLGWARQTTRGWVKVVAPLGGYFLAMTLHGLWNLSATLGAWPIAYIFVLLPTLLGTLILVWVHQSREGKIVRQYLTPEMENGLLNPGAFEEMYSLKVRGKALWKILFSEGLKAWQKRLKLHQMGGELAFHRWRVARGVVKNDETAAAKAIDLQQNMLLLQ